MKKIKCVLFFLLVGVAVLHFTTDPTVPEPALYDAPKFSRAELHRTQLQSRFDNMKCQFTPGYRAEASVPGQVVGATAITEHDFRFYTSCKQGKIFKTQQKTNLAVSGNGWFILEERTGGCLSFTRDGRFEFSEAALRNHKNKSVMGYPLDSDGQIAGELGPINMTMDPNTKLYVGKYTDFQFDEAGVLYGSCSLTDPTTGIELVTSTPLYQVALAKFRDPRLLQRNGETSFRSTEGSGEPLINVPGTQDRGALRPGCLELSNVDYQHETLAISRIKADELGRRQAELIVCGELRSRLRGLLEAQGVRVSSKETLHTLEAKGKTHMLKALASVLEQCEEEDRELTRQLMTRLEPKLVFSSR